MLYSPNSEHYRKYMSKKGQSKKKDSKDGGSKKETTQDRPMTHAASVGC